MADVALSHTIAPPTVSTTEVQENFEALRDGINDHLPMTDADLASANNSVYKTLLSSGGVLSTDRIAGTYTFTEAGSLLASGSTVGGNGLTAIYLDDADYSVGSLTAKLRMRAQVSTNATQPTLTFTVGLYPVTVTGAADAITATLGTVVSGSTVAIASPAASTVTSGVGSDFNIPADGLYVMGVVTSATLTNNNVSLVNMSLQTRNV